ncbi:iron complex transport system substrate-binding protein [Frondihabitans sp. PhB188]|uniref:iron-siderophore ABC transporter substrate-binding protein n=1 Tax=Frondihabitans sp. PhB188 TaxID=2485200 RepID=UPI000F48AE57|nr:iron-siderophore ABC transporter substrate-binding protein [Frondihabitans sp. PhB188]ROQ41324.1 iron complex transport system substrate-binding protein [Frondihabitans sp. PhB188]
MHTSLPRRLAAAVAVAAGLALALAGCSTSASPSSTESSSSAGAEAGAFPVTLDSTLGSTTIESAPKRVVTIGWGSADTVVSLGVVPVGIEKVTYGQDSNDDYPWVSKAITKMGGTQPETFDVYPDIDMTKLAELNPGLIIAVQSGITDKQYKTLSALAPTVAYPGKAWLTPWDTQIETIGKALGKPKLAAEKVDEITTRLAAVKADHPDFSKLTFTYASMGEPGRLAVYLDGDPRVALIKAMGLTESSVMKSAKADSGSGSYLATLGLEKSDLLDSTDIVFTWYYDKANKAEIDEQPLIASIPAIKRGSVVSSTDPQFVMGTTFITPLSVPYAIDEYVPLITEAASKVG